jgi:hypothetical protein
MTLALLVFPLTSLAQESRHRMYLSYGHNVHGYPGGINKHTLAGGGDEFLKKTHFALGGDLAMRGDGPPTPGCESSDTCGLDFSLAGNVTYYIPLRGRFNRMEPFLLGGYSLTTRNDSSFDFHYPHMAVGFHLWLDRDVGFRVEARDNLRLDDGRNHYLEFRVGLVMR